MSEPFIGEIKMVSFNYAPRSYAKCDGALLPISQNDAMYALLGTQYGGDGRTNFKLPDLRGRTPMHQGNGPGLTSRAMGQSFGSQTNRLDISQLPTHSHSLADIEAPINAELNISIPASSENATQDSPIDGVMATAISAGRAVPSYAAESNGDMKAFKAGFNTTAQLNGNTQNTDNNTEINNLQPVQVVNFIIALLGIFPPRS
ncbi:tail fiber protein [Shewanella sp. D64]|uniref:phage tail protein n=1 Tax=unclassified Shewanella TaxID=196818 RepID=UPI0022BA3FE3|nr:MULTISPECIES: tail fiber protein [unclassified Shewanella]MEC4726956.1 tail fiber protein [Shewanella sp. D64]MEC4738547.1 tail fiber protein [Shewanella sp. E94]WBJ93765.1 tail fiber protein [Shewanella sp. MTB7]